MRLLFLNDAPIIKYGLAAGVEELGFPVSIIGLWKYSTPEDQRVALQKSIESFHPDAVFIEGHPGIDQRTLFDAVKDLKQNLVYWAIEDPPHHSWISVPYAQHSRIVFTTAVEYISKYKALGIPSDLLLFGCNPKIHRRVKPQVNLAHDIVFVGSNYDIRYEATKNILQPLLEEEFDLFVWGLWWDDPKRPVTVPPEKYGGILPYEKLAEAYSSAKIVLGLHCDASSRTQTSMRTFEVLGCNAFYLTQYTPAHEHHFDNHKHLVWSQSPQETVSLARYYLEHPRERETIAHAGQSEVYAKHNYRQRAEHLIGFLEKYL